MIADELPPHRGSLILQHNVHRARFETVRDLIAGNANDYAADRFPSVEDRQNCIDLDEIWTLQWYPDAAVPMLTAHAPSLPVLLKFAAGLSAAFAPAGWPR